MAKKPSKPEALKVHLRWMIRRDMPAVLEIERESFQFPWSEADFIRCLRRRTAIGMVADCDGEVLAFMLYELQPTRIDLLDLAVAADARGRGLGRALIDKLKTKLVRRRTAIVAEVRETNLAAQLWFRRLGFRAISIRRSAFDVSPEDAYLFRYRRREPGGIVNRLKALLF